MHLRATEVAADVPLRAEAPLAQQAAPRTLAHRRERLATHQRAPRRLELHRAPRARGGRASEFSCCDGLCPPPTQ
eukprot:scaffold177195_cov32-Tisochrysis_lutea.AAC.4